MAQAVYDLTGPWLFKEYPISARRMRDLDADDWLKTNVPASIFTSLIHAGRIEATDLNTNPENFQWVSQKPWVYKKTFTPPKNLFKADRIHLIFEGLDTAAQIWLNEKLIAKTCNMFIPHRFDVTEHLKRKDNTLLIKFTPALEHAARLEHRYGPLNQLHAAYSCRPYIRKAQYQFGSESSPPLPGCGIFRPARLEAHSHTRIEDIHIRTIDCNQHYADIGIVVTLDRTPQENMQQSELTCQLNITGGGLDLHHTMQFAPETNRQATVIRIDRPIMWWPRPYGVQHLHTLTTTLLQNEKKLDQATNKFGICHTRLLRNKDKYGRNFQFEINSHPIHIKGANWLPASIFPGAATNDDYEKLLNRAADANINMLRVWAGGYYETDEFYDLCDQLGILVWQDFMFDSAYYPDREWFTKLIKSEADTIIKRLRNHPSLALWCGNNKIDSLHAEAKLGMGRKFYGKDIYHKILPKLVSELDPDRNYTPTTPAPVEKNRAAVQRKPSPTNQWNVWKQNAPVRDYLQTEEHIPRFVTEFGLQAMPNLASLRTFCPGHNLQPSDFALEKHNYLHNGNTQMARYTVDLFGYPKNLNELVYLSQLTQGRAAKSYIEHLRTFGRINNGMMFWHFNDCCPALSFAALDYLKQPKALYYYARRAFAPIITTLTPCSKSSTDKNTVPFKYEAAYVINDSPESATATLTCSLLDLSGDTIDQASFPVVLAPFSRSTPIKLPAEILNPKKPERSLLKLTYEDHKKILAQNDYLFLPDKYIDWPDTLIKTTMTQTAPKQCELELMTNTIAKDVQIITDIPAQLSDNFLLIQPNIHHKIKIRFELPCPPQQQVAVVRCVASAIRFIH